MSLGQPLVPLDPPLREFRSEDAGAMARINDMASGGIALTVWQRRVGPDGDPWKEGHRIQLERAQAGETVVVVDQGSGCEAGMICHAVGTDPTDPECADPEWVPLRELDNLALGSWHIDVIATLPEARRRGHGARLMAAAQRMATALGHSAISLAVSDANPDAMRLYERSGFIAKAQRPLVKGSWKGPGDNWVLMIKSL